ncbi:MULTISPECIES: fumarate hydratase [Fusobacterium]|uniref:Hydrolyase, tartrate alpha subunit/fumarate domain protein, Fe-S type n=1 Tax=Fusobacterium equinum TaxID=134605 RepID=A0A133NKV3_9FUSO|nr:MULTISPECIES: fumarate hydratase [Fusobacterium]AVQ16955.1 fumarate hydratase [Fusobacterium gonidiaformans ATCC 25563]EFS28800.1 hydrolyase, tartrate alpha subunit/fumarate domain-containing protein, Fe-S type [Fusobacterium gonidiaformans ATCC 25563]KXA16914.1 hydrolyase, tartrate alpha subunit/fumarate domain protein, Fe-S type [Fusobacterium equinum]
MKKLDLCMVTNEVEKMCMAANYYVDPKVLQKIETAYCSTEKSPLAKNVLEQILENDKIAEKEQVPMCQDTGMAVIFVEIGTEVYIPGDIYEAIQEGVRRGYTNGYLRKSMVKHPLDRINTKDNTPAIIHTKMIAGSDQVKIILAPKGGGSENMSLVKMLKPADGIEGVKKLVLELISNAGGNPCPPITVGVGIGGSFEKAALLAKEALLRDTNDRSSDPIAASLEEELLEKINKLGIGPLGLGGKTTALAVKVNVFPCHIACLPVAINLNCHAVRHQEVIL